MRRVLRFLRVIFSTLCLTVAVLCAVLWARSYWWGDNLVVPREPGLYGFLSQSGQLLFQAFPQTMFLAHHRPMTWELRRWRISEREPRTRHRDLNSGEVPASLYTPALAVWSGTRLTIVTVWMQTWLPTYLFAALALLPWMKWPPRYGLRTILIATTVVAIMVALVVISNRIPFG